MSNILSGSSHISEFFGDELQFLDNGQTHIFNLHFFSIFHRHLCTWPVLRHDSCMIFFLYFFYYV